MAFAGDVGADEAETLRAVKPLASGNLNINFA